MEFYTEFAKDYDDLVSYDNRVQAESPFFRDVLKKYKCHSILDCACGTGHHIMMLKQLNFNIKGSDSSFAMLEKARANFKIRGISAIVKKSRFSEISLKFNEKFDAIICVGNSLPHLFSKDGYISALNEMKEVLQTDGILILEQRNYNKLVQNKNRFFPVSFRDMRCFFYVLDFYPQKITFNVIDLNLESKEFKVYSTDYYPLILEKLLEFLEISGFKVMEMYGDYNFQEFNKISSNSLILICKKKENPKSII